jgi:hypothetical protein
VIVYVRGVIDGCYFDLNFFRVLSYGLFVLRFIVKILFRVYFVCDRFCLL